MQANNLPRLGLSLLLLLATPLPLAAQQDMRAADRGRLDGYDATAGAALLAALAGGAQGDVAALTGALSGTPDVAFDESLAGDWSCRTIRLGGAAALTVFSPFDCRFTAGPQGFLFEKLTGSERTRGTIALRDGRAIYLGVGFAAGTVPPAYADLPATPDVDGAQPHVAVLERIGPTRARLMFPAPGGDSRFDILELTR